MSTDALSRQLVVSGEWIDKLGRILLVVLLVELLLGGNGYLVELASIRFRVLLFPICLAWVFARLASRPAEPLPRVIWRLLAAYVAVTALTTEIGVINGHSLSGILSELKPLSYFPMLLFFATAIRSREDIALVARLIVVCGMIQAAAYLLVLAAMYCHAFTQTEIFLFLRQSDEFIFRHHREEGELVQDGVFIGFFYKGAFHLGIAALFSLFAFPRARVLSATLLIAALALSLTRGLMLSAVLATLGGAYLIPGRGRKLIALAVVAFGTVLQYAALQLEQTPVESPSQRSHHDRDSQGRSSATHSLGEFPTMSHFARTGDDLRIKDVRAVLTGLDLQTTLFGKGLGGWINGRPRIEINYAEVFHKQGLMGLSFWLALLGLLCALYKGLSWSDKMWSLGFLLSTVYVYAANATNTFLTGSIGMSIVLISLSVMLVLSSERELVDRQLLRDGST